MEKILVKNSTIAEMLGAVHTHTHTHTHGYILNNKKRAVIATTLKVMDKKENQD